MPQTIKTAFIKKDVVSRDDIFKAASSDILLLATKEYSAVSVKDELSGRSNKLFSVGELTKTVKGLTFLALETDNFGSLRRSVAVFSKGKLIKLIDSATCDDKRFSPSFGYKTLCFSGLKIGVAVGRDLIEPDCMKVLSLSDCDVIINLSGDFYDFSLENLVSSLSYVYGMDILSVGGDRACFASKGRVLLSSDGQKGECVFSVNRTYREITVKKRG